MMIRYLVVIMIILFGSTVLADQEAGTIAWHKGSVSVHGDSGFWGRRVKKNGQVLDVGDTIKTKRSGRAFIDFADGSKIVLQQYSSLLIKDINSLNVDQGTVLFEVKKRGRAIGLAIRAATVALGVRGTRFAVVNEGERVSVFLKNGELVISAIEGEFKRHRQSMEEEFDTMVKGMEDDYERTKTHMKEYFEEATRQMEQGDLEYVKEFPIFSNTALSISDGEVKSIPFPEDMEEAFEQLDEF